MITVSPFIKPYVGSIGMDHLISELCPYIIKGQFYKDVIGK